MLVYPTNIVMSLIAYPDIEVVTHELRIVIFTKKLTCTYGYDVFDRIAVI